LKSFNKEKDVEKFKKIKEKEKENSIDFKHNSRDKNEFKPSIKESSKKLNSSKTTKLNSLKNNNKSDKQSNDSKESTEMNYNNND